MTMIVRMGPPTLWQRIWNTIVSSPGEILDGARSFLSDGRRGVVAVCVLLCIGGVFALCRLLGRSGPEAP